MKTRILKRSKKNQARVLDIETDHGHFQTPAFMPVGTRAIVSSMTPDEVLSTRSQIILGGNTYHMLVTPGLEIIRKLGGMHKFMGWQRPMLTDSGGFQVFSLSKKSDICTIDDEAATFKSPKSGDVIRMTPESSIEAQRVIGADIIMAFDHCTPDTVDKETVKAAMERTHRWLLQSKEYHAKHPRSEYGYGQALFGIIQGAAFRDLREASTEFIVKHDLDGVAIGGETIGFDMKKTVEILSWIAPGLPEHKPRYTMGVGGSPQDLLDVIAHGIDMFDCVAPTRNARHGALYCGSIVRKGDWFAFESEHPNGRLNLNNQAYATDDAPIMEGCACMTCATFSRGYLRYLLKEKEQDYFALASLHNVHVMQNVCDTVRAAVMDEESVP